MAMRRTAKFLVNSPRQNVTRRSLVFLVSALCLGSMVFPSAAAEKPNIVFILADDLGWADVGFRGHAFYETPNLDRLAADGMTFTDLYSCGPNCAPTRACLMTGMYTPRHHLYTPGGRSKGDIELMKLKVPARKDASYDDVFESRIDEISPSWISMAEVLGPAGYVTARFGKWHLGPDRQGFDVSSSNGTPGVEKRHYGEVDVADRLTDASLKFIDENRRKPFFLYIAHWDVHTPIRAKKKVVNRYRAKLAGIEEDWNPAYAGMIEAVDKCVGRVRAKLRELNLEKNTLVFFSSDNGGLPRVTRNAPLKGGKGSLFEGGIRVPGCCVWPAVVSPGSTCEVPVTSVDFLPTFAEIAGAELPKSQPVDGRSFVELLQGRKALEERAIFWHYPLYLSGGPGNKVIPVAGTDRYYWRAVPAGAIRKGDWKLIHYFENDTARLFNLRRDISEENDLFQSQPEKAQELLSELKSWQDATAAPIPTELNPRFDPTGG